MSQASAFQESNSEWAQFQASPDRGGVSFTPAPIADPGLEWSAFHYRTNSACGGDGISVSPVVSGKLVYTFDANGTVRAFDKNDGQLVWRQETVGGPVAQLSTPASGDGKLFVAANTGDIFIFDAETGENPNTVHVTDGNFECPVTYYEHRIYLGEGRKGSSDIKYYYCFDEDGNEVWKHPSRTAGFAMAGASVAGDYLIYPVCEGSLVCLYRENGTFADEIALNNSSRLSFAREDAGEIQASVNSRDGYVYVTSGKNDVGYVWKLGFDKETGQFLNKGWSRENGPSSSTPAVYGGKVYVGQGDCGVPGNFSCLDDASGKFLWNYSLDTGVMSSPAISVQDGHAYIYFTGTTHNGSLYCLNESGKLLWEFNNPSDDGYITQGAALSNGSVYFGTDAGLLYCIRVKEGWSQFHKDAAHTGFTQGNAPDTNNQLWASIPVYATPSTSPVIADGKVFVKCGVDHIPDPMSTNPDELRIVALDQFTGKVLSSSEIGSVSPTWGSLCYGDGKIWYGKAEALNGGATVAAGKVFDSDGQLHHYFCTDAKTGEEKWSFTVDGCGKATPAYLNGKVILTSGPVYGTGDGHVYCVDAESGDEVWNLTLASRPPAGSPAISNGVIYLTSFNGEVLALDMDREGEILWNRTIQKGTSSTPAIAYGNVYVSGGDPGTARTYCFNATDGASVWNTSEEENIGGWTSSLAVADEKVFVGKHLGEGGDYFGHNTTCALDAHTGNVIWEAPCGGSSPAISDEIVFTIGADGRVYAFKDALSGTLEFSHKYPGESELTYYEGNAGTFTATVSEPASLVWNLDGVNLHSDSYVRSSVFPFDSAEMGEHRLTVTASNTNGTVKAHWNWTVIESPVSGHPASDSWPQFHKDVAHTGFSKSYAPNNAKLLWVSEKIGARGTSPVVAEGKVFVNCGEYVKALNEFTGEYLHPACAGSERLGSWASPCYHNGTVRCGRPEAVDGGSMVVDGKVFESDWDGHHYFCTDEKSGEEIWTFTVQGHAQGVPAYADGRIFLTSYIWGGNGHVYCVDADTGEEFWNRTTEGWACGSPTVSGDLVYVSEFQEGKDGALHAFYVSSGETAWRKSIKRSDSTPAVAYGNVYVAGGAVGFSELQTYCFNASTGALVWATEPEKRLGDWKNSVAVADGKVFVGKTNEQSSGGNWGAIGIYALDAFTGEEVWSYPEGGESPAVADGMVFTIASGRVYAFGEPDVSNVYFEINTSELDFDSLLPEKNSTSFCIKNRGNSNLNLSAEVKESSDQLYLENLFLNSRLWRNYSDSLGIKGQSGGQSEVETKVRLEVPEDYKANASINGSIIIWAEVE